MKKVTVIFYPDTARIVKGPYVHNGSEPFLINPVLPIGVPPHNWKLVDGKIEIKPISEQTNPIAQYNEPAILIAPSITPPAIVAINAIDILSPRIDAIQKQLETPSEDLQKLQIQINNLPKDKSNEIIKIISTVQQELVDANSILSTKVDNSIAYAQKELLNKDVKITDLTANHKALALSLDSINDKFAQTLSNLSTDAEILEHSVETQMEHMSDSIKAIYKHLNEQPKEFIRLHKRISYLIGIIIFLGAVILFKK